MALTLIAYARTDSALPDINAIGEALAAEPGIEFDAAAEAAYRPWRWTDPVSGARCYGDLGESPIAEDHINPDKDYEGWALLGLHLAIPVAGPHWMVDACAGLLNRIAEAVPNLQWLNTEHTVHEDGEEGPGPLDELALAASWQEMRDAGRQGRDEPRMDRGESQRMYAYRQVVGAARRDHPELRWPGAMVLADGDFARSACLWLDCEQDLALPPVSLVVVRREEATGVLPSDELLTAAGGGSDLDLGGATAVTMTDAVRQLFESAHLWPVDRFQALDDVEWGD